ncbi:glutamine amidotransferase [Polyangium mundeleinium]|uniref:Glutamine amidotransferase n=1 Tax=Polyangium mundeleinium TaxID=2995306 RepID=A0ABT5EZ81_9BACT|nr:glutamine amidotransferase [Polyangium mundeleinium]MDC0747141.1 glutamine amidotransferase [Polyangium mundeleinium]
MTTSLAPSGDLAPSYQLLAALLTVLGIVLLALELKRSRGSRLAAFATGSLASIGLLFAVLRPVAIQSKGSLVGPRVVVLADASRSIDLPGPAGKTRRQEAARALGELQKHGAEVRLYGLAFGKGAPTPLTAALADGAPEAAQGGAEGRLGQALLAARPMPRSDLAGAIESVARAADERPAAIVVLSDGRLDRPGEAQAGEAIRAALGTLTVPVHAVSVATEAPRDASVRAVRAAGAAVAHQPLTLRVEIGCAGGLDCDEIPVSLRELRESGEPTLLASGKANASSGSATLELEVTLDRAGARILEVSIDAPDGDAVPDNDTRYMTIDVARDRVRVLHVAGRPTYDVRALRMWLKADASVDVVAFFILRTPTDDVVAPSEELALIPFPVDELFSEHLPSFDAVVLQDFNAAPYGLAKHLRSLARYVDKGGGLIMVGGPDAFVPGNYAGTPLAEVLPVELDRGADAQGADVGSFVPRTTEAGRAAPVLGPLRDLIGEEWPEMPGANVVGDARPGATVLLEHPTRRTPKGGPMPILALGEHGSGRTIALAIDGSHRLLFSAFAANAAGRAHGAFWDALLGWLMRDPRFEPAVVELADGCIAGENTTLTLRPLPGQKGDAKITIRKLGTGEEARALSARLDGKGEPLSLDAGKLQPGGYSATVEIVPNEAGAASSDGSASAQRGPTTRRDFACERGGDEWADTRPDPERLAAIAAATGGKSVTVDQIGSLPLPAATQIAAERRVSPLLPPWAWTLGAAMLVGVHWIVRRRGGLS